MFLECRTTRINTPRSNELSLVFPFDQFCCRLDRKRYNIKHIDEAKFQKSDIDTFLDEIEKNCGYYKKTQRCTIAAIISLSAFIIMIIVGNVLLNVGLAKAKATSEVEFTKYYKSGLVAGGALTLLVGVIQIIVSVILVAKTVRRERKIYETKTLEMVNKKNLETKPNGLRWKVGRCYNWIELCLDYKVNKYLVKQHSITTLLSDKASGKGINDSIPLTAGKGINDSIPLTGGKGINDSIPLTVH